VEDRMKNSKFKSLKIGDLVLSETSNGKKVVMKITRTDRFGMIGMKFVRIATKQDQVDYQ
jgi:hypothetical protein